MKKLFLVTFLCVNITNVALASGVWYSTSPAATYYGLGKSDKRFVAAGFTMFVFVLANDIHKMVSLKNRYSVVNNLHNADFIENFDIVTENRQERLKLKEDIQQEGYQAIFDNIYRAIGNVATNKASTVRDHWIPLLGAVFVRKSSNRTLFESEDQDAQKKQLEERMVRLRRDVVRERARNLLYQHEIRNKIIADTVVSCIIPVSVLLYNYLK